MPFDSTCLGKLSWIKSQKVDVHLEVGPRYQHCSTTRDPSAYLGPITLRAGLSVKNSPCPGGFAAELQDGMSEDSR